MKRLFSMLVPEAPILVAVALLLTLPSLRGTANALENVFPFTVVAAALLLGWRFNPSPLAISPPLLPLPSLRGTATALENVFPFPVVAAALLLGWRFNRSRLVFSIALLALAEYLLVHGIVNRRDLVLFDAMTFLLPINLALVALLPERGTLTTAGILRWILLGVQALIVVFIAQSFPSQALVFLTSSIVPARVTAWTPVGQPAIIAFLVIAVLLTMAALREQIGRASCR